MDKKKVKEILKTVGDLLFYVSCFIAGGIFRIVLNSIFK